MSDSKPTSLPPSATWTVDQALAAAQQLDLTDVLLVGYGPGGKLVFRSSRMSREKALYLLKRAELHALGADGD